MEKEKAEMIKSQNKICTFEVEDKEKNYCYIFQIRWSYLLRNNQQIQKKTFDYLNMLKSALYLTTTILERPLYNQHPQIS